MSDPEIFFVSGLPKSGSTWVMRTLDALPGIVCRGEGRFAASHLRDVPSLAESLRDGLEPWHRFVSHRKGNWIGLDADLRTVERRNLIDASRAEEALQRDGDALLAAAIRYFLRSGARDRDAVTHVGDKTPVWLPDELNTLRRVMPEAPVICLRRDVKDFLVSLVYHHWRSTREERPDRHVDYLDEADFDRVERFVAAGGRGALVSAQTARRLAGAWADLNAEAEALQAAEPERFRIFDYETLISAPQAGFAGILRFLGTSAEPAALDRALASTSRTAVRRGGNGALRAHVRSGEPGDWRRHLDPEIARLVDSYAGPATAVQAASG